MKWQFVMQKQQSTEN